MDVVMPTVNQGSFMICAKCMKLVLQTGPSQTMSYGKPYAIIGKCSLQFEMLTIHLVFVNGLPSLP